MTAWRRPCAGIFRPTASGTPDQRQRARTSAASGEWNAPSVYWFVGGTDPDIYAKAKAAGRINDLPVNHSPLFAPVIHPTLRTGIEAMVAGALAWLAK